MSLLSRWIPRLCLALVMAGILGLGWLWYTYKSPLGYTPPAQATTVSSARSELDLADEHRVFVYGTLRWPWVRWLITGDDLETSPALLRGFERVGLDLEPAPQAYVPGQLLQVDGDELRALDRYERLGQRYERVMVALANGTPAWVYLRLDPH